MNEKHLPFARHLFGNRAANQRRIKRRNDRLNRQPVLWRSFDHGHIAQPHQRHVQRARDGRGRHCQHVHILAHLFDALLVADSESLLLVHDKQSEILEFHIF